MIEENLGGMKFDTHRVGSFQAMIVIVPLRRVRKVWEVPTLYSTRAHSSPIRANGYTCHVQARDPQGHKRTRFDPDVGSQESDLFENRGMGSLFAIDEAIQGTIVIKMLAESVNKFL